MERIGKHLTHNRWAYTYFTVIFQFSIRHLLKQRGAKSYGKNTQELKTSDVFFT